MLEQFLSFDFADRLVHAHDASLYRMVPKAVARPENVHDVLKLIAWARQERTGLTFRAGGTSLSGQAVTHGLLVLLGRTWDVLKIENEGATLTCGPALRGGVANAHLAKLQRRIGPDPASIQAACMGGIVANNASGMCCGVEENSYQTLVGLKVVLASGLVIDTRQSDCDERLREMAPLLYGGLLSLRERILASPRLAELIRRKSASKNTTGYGLRAFLDFASPSEILSHIMVGSEGTLGFIAEMTLRTVPLRPHRASALLSFRSIEDACQLTPELRTAGCSAIELFDYASVQTLLGRPGIPTFLNDMSRESACLLVQIQAENENQLLESLARNQGLTGHKSIHHRTDFFADQKQQDRLWDLRKGIFPAVGARRPKGTAVIIEDVAFPIERLAEGTRDLRLLLNKHSYLDAVIYGHARDGNLHFVLAQDFALAGEIKRYEKFIDEMVECVAVQYGGALKAEHGTGRNMAPFVEKEWGAEAYGLMRELKRLFDPEGIFNPGVLINSNPRVHLENLKIMPSISEKLDSCIECGFCEPVCPSQGLTLSPRGRIVLERERKLNKSSCIEDLSAVKYELIDTCAADGLCARACPVGINTGEWVKEMRSQKATMLQKTIANWTAKEMPFVEGLASASLKGANAVGRVAGEKGLQHLSGGFNRLFGTPVFNNSLPGHSLQKNSRNEETQQPDVILFRSCVTRTCGVTRGERHEGGTLDALIVCSERAGVNFRTVSDAGQCCGQPWSSKGFKEQSISKLTSLLEHLYEVSLSGRIPIVIDNSPCASSVFEEIVHLSAELRTRYEVFNFWEPVDYAVFLAEKLELNPLQEAIRFFPVCSVRKSGRATAFEKLARKLCTQPVFPNQEACCGMAGDRGLWYPELTENATQRFHWDTAEVKRGFCSSRTCEVALSSSGVQFRSLFDALELASRPA